MATLWGISWGYACNELRTPPSACKRAVHSHACGCNVNDSMQHERAGRAMHGRCPSSRTAKEQYCGAAPCTTHACACARPHMHACAHACNPIGMDAHLLAQARHLQPVRLVCTCHTLLVVVRLVLDLLVISCHRGLLFMQHPDLPLQPLHRALSTSGACTIYFTSCAHSRAGGASARPWAGTVAVLAHISCRALRPPSAPSSCSARIDATRGVVGARSSAAAPCAGGTSCCFA